MKYSFIFILSLFLCACIKPVGPDYQRPAVTVPAKFKEANKHWKIAQPQDQKPRGQWWTVFNDPLLNKLETQLTASNQTIKTAEAQYRQAKALVDFARASYFPTITGTAAITRQKQITPSIPASAQPKGAYTNHSLMLDAAWEPDLWGSVRRSVEANQAGADASKANLALVQLVSQASLAQYYFEMRTLDKVQRLRDGTVSANQKILDITQNRYNSGVAGQADIIQARSQLESSKALALNNKIARAQYEHAIAVLIGKPPALFSLPSMPLNTTPPVIPMQLPSTLLERRPDVANAERLMAQANAQIGIAIAAYFPVLTLSATASLPNNGLGPWFAFPLLNWAVGPQLAETLFDGGARAATLTGARANYDATVATYRQTVLAAFQDVEDNLVALRVLKEQYIQQEKAAVDAELALKLILNQYKAGTVAYSNVLTAQIAANSAQESAIDVAGLRLSAAVGLIKALGGGWEGLPQN